MDTVTEYFAAERAESLFFMVVGTVALLAAALAWSGRWLAHGTAALRRGLAGALVAVALIQITVGATVWRRSPLDAQRVTGQMQTDRARIAEQEVRRMQAVMRNFEIYRWVEWALLVAGLGLGWRAGAGSTARGVGAGLAPQSALMLVLDHFAEERGETYLAFLRALG